MSRSPVGGEGPSRTERRAPAMQGAGMESAPQSPAWTEELGAPVPALPHTHCLGAHQEESWEPEFLTSSLSDSDMQAAGALC